MLDSSALTDARSASCMPSGSAAGGFSSPANGKLLQEAAAAPSALLLAPLSQVVLSPLLLLPCVSWSSWSGVGSTSSMDAAAARPCAAPAVGFPARPSLGLDAAPGILLLLMPGVVLLGLSAAASKLRVLATDLQLVLVMKGVVQLREELAVLLLSRKRPVPILLPNARPAGPELLLLSVEGVVR